MSPSNCWSKYLAAHLLIFVIQPSSSVKFLGFKLRLCKKIQISGVPGSPPFPCLPEIELLDQVFLDFGGSRGGRWPSSYQTIICECHSHPHKTALWCQIFSQILIVGSKRRLLKKARSKKKKWITHLCYTFSYFKLLMHVYLFPFPLSILGALSLHFEIISAMYLLECPRLLGTSFPKNIFTLSSLLVAFRGFGISPYTRQLSARTAAKSHLYWEEVTTVRLAQTYLTVRHFFISLLIFWIP